MTLIFISDDLASPTGTEMPRLRCRHLATLLAPLQHHLVVEVVRAANGFHVLKCSNAVSKVFLYNYLENIDYEMERGNLYTWPDIERQICNADLSGMYMLRLQRENMIKLDGQITSNDFFAISNG